MIVNEDLKEIFFHTWSLGIFHISIRVPVANHIITSQSIPFHSPDEADAGDETRPHTFVSTYKIIIKMKAESRISE